MRGSLASSRPAPEDETRFPSTRRGHGGESPFASNAALGDIQYSLFLHKLNSCSLLGQDFSKSPPCGDTPVNEGASFPVRRFIGWSLTQPTVNAPLRSPQGGQSIPYEVISRGRRRRGCHGCCTYVKGDVSPQMLVISPFSPCAVGGERDRAPSQKKKNKNVVENMTYILGQSPLTNRISNVYFSIRKSEHSRVTTQSQMSHSIQIHLDSVSSPKLVLCTSRP